MSYRGPNTQRMTVQIDDVLRVAGYTATWRQYISASAGVADAGLGDRSYYREQVITALMYQGYKVQPERQRAVGLIADAEFVVSTREQLGRRDELVWRGVTYRVESDPQPARLVGLWMTTVKRGDV